MCLSPRLVVPLVYRKVLDGWTGEGVKRFLVPFQMSVKVGHPGNEDIIKKNFNRNRMVF